MKVINIDNISPDHQHHLTEQFAYVTSLIDQDLFDDAAESLLKLHYADIADFLDNTNHKLYQDILPKIANSLHPGTILGLSDSNKQDVIEVLGVDFAAKLISKLDIEDIIDVIDNLDLPLKDDLLDKLSISQKKQILEGFNYPENTVGRVLEKDFISLKNNWTVEQAVRYIKNSKIQKDAHSAIVVDNRSKPVGTILLTNLIRNENNVSLVDLMNTECKIADAYTKLDELAFVFKQYALTVVPVTNKEGKLVGSISIDNMLYIIEEQNQNEFMHLGGLNNSDIFYNIYTTAKYRFPWLCINLVIACITSLIINQFNDTILQIITIATIMPIVASMGGNAGTQVMTITVGALASRKITSFNSLRVVYKEILVCGLNGTLLGLVGILLTYYLFNNIDLSLVFACAVLVNFLVAGLLGSSIPMILHSLDIDPATASVIFLTACTDATGFFSFLGLSYFFLM